MISAGPTIGLETPYYVNLSRGRKEQYNPEVHSIISIEGNSGPLRGLFESKVVAGLHIRPSLTFESNSTKSRVVGVQAGFLIEAFTRKIDILPETENSAVFTSAFIAIYFGKRR